MANMLLGTVKWYDDIKGFGFIQQQDGKDAFFHKSSLESERTYLSEGQQVEYEASQGQKGPQADRVRAV